MVYSSGEVRQQFAVRFHAKPLRGEPCPDHKETVNAVWVETEALNDLPIHPSMKLRLAHAVKQPAQGARGLSSVAACSTARSRRDRRQPVYSEAVPPARCATATPTPIAAATGQSITDKAASAPRPP
ncbi:hypothetical protein AB0H34_19335 [Saccharopolyspora shandongensis]|uniref:hypothetical protein n=1 Tax=Saccharopolyspora shandongensis TaxID=418495 RepID=UPI0033F701C2